MEEMDKRRKDRLIKGISFNVGVIIVLGWAMSNYIMPKYEVMAGLTTSINDINAVISSLTDNGVDAKGLGDLLDKYPEKNTIPKSIFEDSSKLEKVLKKPSDFKGNYMNWISEENGKVDSIDDTIEENDRILANIIPNYTGMLGGDDSEVVKNQITLESFITYFEKEILEKYSLTSYQPLGLDNIVFPEKVSNTNIGSLEISLDLKGKNSNILSLVNDIQKSGKLIIKDGKLVSNGNQKTAKTKNLSDLSNLLVSIDSLTLAYLPDTSDEASLKALNNGSIKMKFYVEGMNYQKILLLRSRLIKKFEGTKKSKGAEEVKGLKQLIGEFADVCKSGNPLCENGAGNTAVMIIQNLSQKIKDLQPKIDVLKKNETITNINDELASLSEIGATLQSIQTTYNNNAATIEKIKKTSNPK